MAVLETTIAQEASGVAFFDFDGTGDLVETIDKPQLDVTGDIEFVWCGRITDTTNWQGLITKGDPNFSGGEYGLFRSDTVEGTDTLQIAWRNAADDPKLSQTSGGSLVTTGDRWYRVTMDVDNGSSERVITFYRSDDPISTDPTLVAWTQHSQHTISGATSIFSGTNDMQIGLNASGDELTGRCYYAEIRDGIGGTIVANPDFRYGLNVLEFAETVSPWQYVSQPSLDVETDLNTVPSTSLDFRIDMDFKSFDGSRNVAGARNDGSANTEWLIAYNGSEALDMIGIEFQNWTSAVSFWQTGRHQYRVNWVGTTITIYKRDPDLGLALSDDASWSQFDQNTSMDNINLISDIADVGFYLMKTDGDNGHVAWDLHGMWYEVDSVLESEIDITKLIPDFGANTFNDNQGNQWTWTGVDPFYSHIDDVGNLWTPTGAIWNVADYTTITAWEADAPSLGTDIWKGVISDNSEYNENVTMSAAGTPSITTYLYLTVAAANRHSGVAGTGHARIRGDTNALDVITMSSDFTRVEWLEIKQDATATGDAGIWVDTSVEDVLIEYCIIWDDSSGFKDGISFQEGSADPMSGSVSNCIIYGFMRAIIRCRNQSGNVSTIDVNVDHCTLRHKTGSSDVLRGALSSSVLDASDVNTINVYNTIGYTEDGVIEAFADMNATDRGAPVGTAIWNGSHNLAGDQGTNDEIDGTDNTSDWQFATDGDSETTQDSGAFIVFKDIGTGTEDFTLLDGAVGNLAVGNGTNRIGSEPDARQDFSIDITGNVRAQSNVDIGAHNFSQATRERTIKQPLLTTEGYFLLDGTDDYLETGDTPELDITGDIEIIALARMADWTDGGSDDLLVKWDGGGNERSYRFFLNGSGKPGLRWSTNGTDNFILSPGSAPSLVNNEHAWFRVTFDVDDDASDSTVTTYWSADPITTEPGSVSWTTIGSAKSGSVESIHAGTAVVRVGGNEVALTGHIFGVWLYDGIGGTEVANPDFRTQEQNDWSQGAGPDDHSRLWTPQNDAIWVGQTAGLDGFSYFTLDGTGDHETPDTAPLSVTGDIELIALVAPDDWSPASNYYPLGKYVATGDQRSFRMLVNGSGNLGLGWSEDGIANLAENSNAAITTAAGISDGDYCWLRVTVDVSVSEIKYWWSRDPIDTSVLSVSWTQLGSTDTQAATSFFDSTAPLRIGQNLAGKIYGAWLYDGIGGIEVANPDFRTREQSDWSQGAGDDDHTNTWTPDGGVWTDSGTDYTSIGAWEADTPTLALDLIWKGIVSDNNEYNENVDMNATGTPSIDTYQWLTVDPLNRHKGVVGTGHARMRGNTNASNVLTVSSDFARVEWLEVKQDSTATGDAGIWLNFPIENALIEYCIIWDDGFFSRDGISFQAQNADPMSASISNCIVYGFLRASIRHRNQGGSSGTMDLNVDHCTVMHRTGSSAVTRGALVSIPLHASDVNTLNVYNTIGYTESISIEAFADTNLTDRGAPVGTAIWNGSHNLAGDQGTHDEIDGTDNITDWQHATDGDEDTSQSSGSFVVFRSISAGTENFLLLDKAAGNLAVGNGVDRQGSEPDSRQDFSIDILGNPRPIASVDIGAHNVLVGPSFLLRRRQLTTVRM